jgi:hypothetical protein
MVVFLSEKVLRAPISDDKRLNQEVSVLQNHHRKTRLLIVLTCSSLFVD